MEQTPQRKRKWDMPGDPPAGVKPGLAPHLIQEAQAAAIAAAQRLTAVRDRAWHTKDEALLLRTGFPGCTIDV